MEGRLLGSELETAIRSGVVWAPENEAGTKSGWGRGARGAHGDQLRVTPSCYLTAGRKKEAGLRTES